MTMASRAAPRSEFYDAARVALESVIERVRDIGVGSHTELEGQIRSGMNDVGRRLFQGHLDALFEQETAEIVRWVLPEGSEVRARKRELESGFGRMDVRRHGYTPPGEGRALFPMDAGLNLPRELYSLPLRREVAEEVIGVSFERTVERVDQTTAGHVPKRQAEQMTVRSAKDFESFYATRVAAANDTLSPKALQIMSSDSTGVRMRPEALREATRKEAEAGKAGVTRGDPMAERKLRRNDKRMAIVTAVWEQEPHVRTAKNILDELKRKKGATKPKRQARKKPKAPPPQNKRVSASVEKSQTEGIAEMFDEATRRNPDGARCNVVLVDGEEHQKDLIKNEAGARKMQVTMVVDIIHVIHYLWLIAAILCRKNQKASADWVAHILAQLLTTHPLDVIATIRATATKRAINGDERLALDKAVDYLRKNSVYIHYAHFLAAGLPIATGIIEGACRHLVKDRLGITGACWGLASADAVLKLRAIRSSGDWDDYWRFHEQQERERNHPLVAQAA